MTFGVGYDVWHLVWRFVSCIWCVALRLTFVVAFVLALMWHLVCGIWVGMWCNSI